MLKRVCCFHCVGIDTDGAKAVGGRAVSAPERMKAMTPNLTSHRCIHHHTRLTLAQGGGGTCRLHLRMPLMKQQNCQFLKISTLESRFLEYCKQTNGENTETVPAARLSAVPVSRKSAGVTDCLHTADLAALSRGAASTWEKSDSQRNYSFSH